MNMKSLIVVASISCFVSGCSGETVLARADGLKTTPSWASYTVASFEDGNLIKFVGNHDLDENQRISSGCKIAANKAKGEISGEIEQKLSFAFQHAEEGTEIGSDQTRYIGGEASKIVISKVHFDGCYWELIKTPNGDRRYRVFSKISIPKSDLAAAIRHVGHGNLSSDFAKQTAEHWDELRGKTR